MCGIFGYIGPKQEAATIVFEGLKRLEYRGYDSWGTALVPDSKDHEEIMVQKQVGKIGNSTIRQMPIGTLSIGHTRWATHGGVTKVNAHPHLDCSKTIAIVHNGIVENYDELRKDLVAKGHTFVSETDSEVIAHLLEENGQHMSFSDAFRLAFGQVEGLNAIVAINLVERVMLAARNGSPLVLGFGKHEHFISSDPAALLPLTKEVIFLENDQMALVADDKVTIENVTTRKPVTYSTQLLEWESQQAEMGDFTHFMLKEMHEQPAVVASIAAKGAEDAKKISALIKESEKIYLLGCGTASHAAMIGTYLLSTISHRHVQWAVASECNQHLQFITPKSLVIAFSQSGETMDTLEVIKKAKLKGAKILAVVNVYGSSLHRMAEYQLMIGAGPEKAVASTKAFMGKLAHFILLSYALIDQHDEGKKILSKVVNGLQQILLPASTDRIVHLASAHKDVTDLYVIGRGVSYPIALEIALKIKEVSYVHAEGLAAGELKHGVLALIEKGTPCIVLLPNDETYQDSLAAAMEIKARGGFVIGISHQPSEVLDVFLPIQDSGIASMLEMVLVGQLLSYFLSVSKNLDPDKPRNLAKSVTVK